MEALFHTDSSFFKISTDTFADITNDVISLEIAEELGTMTTGTLTLYDPFLWYANQLKTGRKVNLTWGYKGRNQNYTQLEMSQKNQLEMLGEGVRRGLQSVIRSPSGTGSTEGIKTYSCSFYAYEFMSNMRDSKLYTEGTKGGLILQLMQKLGVGDFYVTFEKQNDILNKISYVRQNETYYKLLFRLAYEWRCFFKLGYSASGTLCGLFVDSNKINHITTQNYVKQVNGATVGNTKLLEFGIGSTQANVISYSWQNHEGDSGTGDNVRIEIIDNKPVMTRYIASTQTIMSYSMNEGRMENYLKTHQENQGQLLGDLAAANAYDSAISEKTVGYFFDEVESRTAPQGYGYTLEVNMLGEPLMTPLIEITLGAGFPDLVRTSITNRFYVKKAVHKLDINGYKTNISISDAISTFQTSAGELR